MKVIVIGGTGPVGAAVLIGPGAWLASSTVDDWTTAIGTSC